MAFDTLPADTSAASAPLGQSPIPRVDLTNQAACHMLGEIASLAVTADEHCFIAHGELFGGDMDAEAVSLELNYLRDVIQRMGWMADHALDALPSGSPVRGGAEQWLLGPMTVDAFKALRKTS